MEKEEKEGSVIKGLLVIPVVLLILLVLALVTIVCLPVSWICGKDKEVGV